MNNADATKIKQQIVEKIKNSTNILVTVSRDPSVDALSAAIGLSAILNKVDKHSTAIFSGLIPPAINFLEPENVFENSADSLRDFIIALDKEKADHLRYKVEGDVVKIFITPYHTTITSDDLDFSQGDFNVELVLALGVDNQDHLDTALSAHGNILEDVTIATFTAGEQTSTLGSMDWHDDSASSLSEMVTSISEALKADKPILDKQVATALLTGIVASTDRFSNTRTTSKVMTMAAQLMAAGADQQLIAAKLNEAHEINQIPVSPDQPVDIPMVPESTLATEKVDEPGNLTIQHAGEPEYPDPVVPTAESPKITEDIAPEPYVQPVETDNASMGIDLPETKAERVIEPLPESEMPELVLSDTPSIENAFQAELAQTSMTASTLPPEESEAESHEYLGAPVADPTRPSFMNSALEKEDDATVDIFADSPSSSTLAETTEGLPLPPPLPTDFSTLSEPLPNMNVAPEAVIDTSASTLPPQFIQPDTATPAVADPGQFQIPGQS